MDELIARYAAVVKSGRNQAHDYVLATSFLITIH